MAKRTNNVFVCYLWFPRALSDLTVNKIKADPEDFFFSYCESKLDLKKNKKKIVMLVFMSSQSSVFLCHQPLSLKRWTRISYISRSILK